MQSLDSFKSKKFLQTEAGTFVYFDLKALPQASRLPFSLKILLENLLRREDGKTVKQEDIEALASWNPQREPDQEIAFMPARVLLQDFTGVPAVVDLAAMRDAMKAAGENPEKVNPLLPVDLVIDHSLQVDYAGDTEAFAKNVALEYERNAERYQLLRWAQSAFRNFRVVPPGTGIIHQVNLEYLAGGVCTRKHDGEVCAFPDTLVGTDSHTTQINGLGVLGWGVGGIEAEAAMLGQPISMLIPQVIGMKLSGRLPEGATATDLVLTVTEILRKKNVVGKFVEFFGPGLDALTLPDRATVANMAPEYGATMGFFPIDHETLNYLRLTGRDGKEVKLVESYCKAQGLLRSPGTDDPLFSETVELDLGSIEPCLAGPRRPQDRVLLKEVKQNFSKTLETMAKGRESKASALPESADHLRLDHGAVVIASITSCTNTSNPSVMLGAGLLAKKAVERGLTVKPWVKTSLAPGSQVVMDYLAKADLIRPLEKLKFHLVGFGCATCIGNSGPLAAPVAEAIRKQELVAAAVLSGNRNFEGRVHSLVRANYLASPALVIAYAIAGTVDIDLLKEPLGTGIGGKNIYLRDIWPTGEDIKNAMFAVRTEGYREKYSAVFEGDKRWRAIRVSKAGTFSWEKNSTYIRRPPFLDGDFISKPEDLPAARVLAFLGDSVTTDHISPAGSIAEASPAGKFLVSNGVSPKDFNSYGSRRGNHEVMMRGTFANVRLKNKLVPGTEGGITRHFPDGETLSIYDAAMRYRTEGVSLIILAGKEYGSGSSRDWAAKGPRLLGVRAVMAESFERIHRSNLIGMGILPLQFEAGTTAASLGITGEEVYDLSGISGALAVRKSLPVIARGSGSEKTFRVILRIDTPEELAYIQSGGILPYVLKKLIR